MPARNCFALLLAALLAASPAFAAAQSHRDDDDDTQSRIDTTVALSPGGVVELSLVSGEIKVTSWSSDKVQIKASTEGGILRVDATPGRVSLSVRSDRGDMGDTQYQVTIPAGARLIAHSVSGDVTTSGGSEVEAHSTSGDVDVSTVTGRATVESVSGSVKATRIGAGLRVSSVSGDVTADNVTGDIDAQSVSGDIVLGGARSSFVRTQTVSGETRFGGTIDRNGRYEFHSHSGDVELAISPAGVTFSVQTFSGDLQSDFPMTLQPGAEMGSKHMEFSINGGGARVAVETFSGDVTIERAGTSAPQD
ncbi:MAG TPA: DUF4097 family beta strand repeat-containing protein [Gemmatimonadaceae bacterium]